MFAPNEARHTPAAQASGPADGSPLAGLKVIDWTHVLAGPFTGYQLALLGAEVIRIERPDSDDMIRSAAADPALGALGLGETFVCQGSAKRSLALDARDPRARAALQRLIAGADVLLENFRPGKLAALGFDPAQLITQHPDLTVCSITGFGPGSDRRAYDHVVQAASGLMVANAATDGTPQRIGFPVIDYAVGQQAALAVMTALYRRAAQRAAGLQRTRGEWLQVTMLGAALTLLGPVYADQLVSGRSRPRSASTAFSGSPLSGTFRARDGWLAFVCNAPAQGAALLDLLEQAEAEPDVLAELRQAVAARDVTTAQRLLSVLFAARPLADWIARFDLWGIPGSAVKTPAAAAAEVAVDWPRVPLPATDAQGTGVGRVSPVPGIGFASNLPLTPHALRAPSRRGQDTVAILRELGLSVAAIDDLLAAGVAADVTRDTTTKAT